MGTIARMNVVLGMDSKDFESGVKNATSAGESLANKLGKIGQGMTAGITLPIAPNQQALCARLAAAGEGIDLGLYEPAATRPLAPAVQALRDDPQRLAAMAGALFNRCDGQGAKCLIVEALHSRADALPAAAARTKPHRHV